MVRVRSIFRQHYVFFENDDKKTHNLDKIPKLRVFLHWITHNYMTWSKEFCIGEQYNSTTQLQKMYTSDYALTLDNKK